MNIDPTIKQSSDETIHEKDELLTIAERTDASWRKSTAPRLKMESFKGYRILEEFPAAGGEADIYLVGDAEDSRKVLKLYRLGLEPREEVLKKTKELSEEFPEHIIAIYDFGYDDETGRWFELQEFAQFGALKEIVNFKLSKKVLDRAVSDIVEALNILHANSILHLDLKPSNILIRSIKPLDLVFTDFGISSILDSELSRKMTDVKGTPLYWSPEAFTGVVGKEADYWSLGMIIIELLLGRHPFGGLDTKVIMYTLSTQGVAVPEDISDDYKLLLKGLLTREPQWRWGYDEVKKWLGGEMNIPVYYASATQKEGEYARSYKFMTREYCSLSGLISAFVESEPAWESGKQHLFRGYITRWLESNEDYETGVKIEQMKDSAVDADMAVIKIVNTFNKGLPFILYGKLITLRNLYIYAAKTLRDEAEAIEDKISKALTGGKMLGYYGEYLSCASKGEDDLYAAFDMIGKTIMKRSEYLDKLKDSLRLLDLLLNPESFLLPADIRADLLKNADIVSGNISCFLKKDEFADLAEKYVLTEDLTEAAGNCSFRGIDDYKNGIGLLREIEDRALLLSRDEYVDILKEYVLPDWLNSGLTGKSFEKYHETVGLLRELKVQCRIIKASDFISYLKKNPSFRTLIDDGGKAHSTFSIESGHTFEQKMISRVKSMQKDEYLKVVQYINNDIMASMLPVIDRIEKALNLTPVDDTAGLGGYLAALKSSDIRWDELDKKILTEMYACYCKKTGGAGRIDRALGDASEKDIIRILLELLTGMDMGDEKSMKTQWALAGAISGIVTGLSVGAAIKVLNVETNIIGLLLLGTAAGMVRRSGAFGLLMALAGLLGEVFLGNAIYVEMADILAISVVGCAATGAMLGRKKERLSMGERIYRKYYARINHVFEEMEART